MKKVYTNYAKKKIGKFATPLCGVVRNAKRSKKDFKNVKNPRKIYKQKGKRN